MIESKPKRLDIRDLSVPEPIRETARLFNPKKDIPNEDWQHLDLRVSIFVHAARSSKEFNWVERDQDFLLRVGFLEPEILRRNITDEDWDMMKKSIPGAGIMEETKALLTLKIINPEKFAGDKRILKNFRKKYNFFQRPLRDVVGFNSAGYVRLIDEEGFNNLSVDWTGTEERQKLISDWKDAKRWDHVGSMVANLKLINPPFIHELPLYKDDWADLWDYLYGQLKENSVNAASKNSSKFLEAAYIMAILAAEEFRFEDNKFQVIYKPEEQSDHVITTIPMPERRRF